MTYDDADKRILCISKSIVLGKMKYYSDKHRYTGV